MILTITLSPFAILIIIVIMLFTAFVLSLLTKSSIDKTNDNSNNSDYDGDPPTEDGHPREL